MIETNWKYIVAGLGIFLYALFGYDPIPVESIGICVELIAMFIGVTLILKGLDRTWKDIYKSKNGRRVAVTVLFAIPLLLLWSMVYATRLSVKRKLQSKMSHAGMTRSTLLKRPFFNRVVIIGNSTCFL